MEWIADPTVWVGLLTLIVLEIVLGIAEWGGWTFEVAKVEGRRIARVIARRNMSA
jgi:hypothetical protein